MGAKTKKCRWQKGSCLHFSPVDGPESPEIYSYSYDSSETRLYPLRPPLLPRWEPLLEEHDPTEDYPEYETEPSDNGSEDGEPEDPKAIISLVDDAAPDWVCCPAIIQVAQAMEAEKTRLLLHLEAQTKEAQASEAQASRAQASEAQTSQAQPQPMEAPVHEEACVLHSPGSVSLEVRSPSPSCVPEDPSLENGGAEPEQAAQETEEQGKGQSKREA